MRTVDFDRDKVLDAAMEVFWEKGYGESSIDDLSNATSLRRSSLYNSFTDKRELFLTTLRRYHARCSEQYAELETSNDPVESITGFIRSIIDDELHDQRGMGCMIANCALEFGGRDEEIVSLTSYNLTTMSAALASAIRHAQSRNQVDRDLDADSFAHSLVVTVQGMRVTAKAIAPELRAEWLGDAIRASLAPLSR